MGEFANGLDAANGTLIGMLKTVKGTAQAALKPFGDQIVDMTKGPLAEFNEGLTGFINSVMPSVVVFFNRLLPAAFENLGGVLSWFDSFMRESLPSMVDGFREGYDTVRTFFQGTGRALREFYPFLQRAAEGFDILFETILGPLIGGVARMFGGALIELTDFFEQNRSTMASIGETIAGVFASDGFLMRTIKSGAKAIATMIDSLGPVILRMIDYLEAPFYLFDIINNNKDALDELAGGLEYFVEKAFGPFFDFIVRIIEFVVKSGPDIADIFRTAADLLDPMISLANTLLSVLETLGGIKLIFAFLIGKAVLNGIMALGSAFGMAGAQAGILASLFGSGAGGATRLGGTRRGAMLGGLGAAAGAGLMAYGHTMENPYMAAGTNLLGGAALAGGIYYAAGGAAATGVGLPIALGLTALATGVSAYTAFTGARSRNRQANEAEGAALMAAYDPAGIQFGSQFQQLNFARAQSTSDVRNALANYAGKLRDADLQGKNDLELTATGLLDTEIAGARGARGVGAFLESFGVDITQDRFAIQEQIRGFDDKTKETIRGGLLDRIDSVNSATVAQDAALVNMERSISFLTENFDMTEQAAAELADTMGLDLSVEVDDLTLALGPLQQAFEDAKGAAEIFGGTFDQFVFEPLRAMEFDAELKSLGGILDDAVAGGMVFGDNNPIGLFVGRTLESIPREILRQLSSGVINAEEALAMTDSMFAEVLGDITDEELATQVNIFKDKVIQAITEGEGLVNAEADRLASVLGQVVDAVGGDAQMVIDGIGSKAVEVLNSLGVELPTGDTASPKSNLMRTMGTHSMIDAMISGNRQVTSGYRTHNLGSSNSDHVNGLALDITGDNLGAYATAMRSAGGFAELHGSGSSRHLHVVPPMAMGDTPSPQAPMLPSLAQRNTGKVGRVTNNITVNPAPGMSEAVLAKAVAREIGRMNTDAMERS